MASVDNLSLQPGFAELNLQNKIEQLITYFLNRGLVEGLKPFNEKQITEFIEMHKSKINKAIDLIIDCNNEDNLEMQEYFNGEVPETAKNAILKSCFSDRTILMDYICDYFPMFNKSRLESTLFELE
jgi:DNA-directed RNA polymerase specialized sigma54-like protein